MRFAERVDRIEASRTVRFTELLEKQRQEGREIISFAIGEPEYPTPGNVLAATRDALEQGKTRYGPVQGLEALTARLAEPFEGLDQSNILVSNGSKQSLYSIFRCCAIPETR
jgi:aspartate aminotransferase